MIRRYALNYPYNMAHHSDVDFTFSESAFALKASEARCILALTKLKKTGGITKSSMRVVKSQSRRDTGMRGGN